MNGSGGILSNLRKTSSLVGGLPPLPLLPTITAASLEKQKDLYAAVGRALTSWAGVEDGLCRVLCATLNPKNTSPIERAYWAIASFDGRLKMTDKAVQQRLDHAPDKFAVWTDAAVSKTYWRRYT